jgi:hypothetical protein
MNKFTEYLLSMVLGEHGRTEYQRVKTDKQEAEQQRLRNIRDQNIETARAASENATANMSPDRQQLIEMAMKVQRYTEERVFEGVSADRRTAMREDALDQVFGEGGGLKEN